MKKPTQLQLDVLGMIVEAGGHLYCAAVGREIRRRTREREGRPYPHPYEQQLRRREIRVGTGYLGRMARAHGWVRAVVGRSDSGVYYITEEGKRVLHESLMAQ